METLNPTDHTEELKKVLKIFYAKKTSMKRQIAVNQKTVEIIEIFSRRNELGLFHNFLDNFVVKFYGEFENRRERSAGRALLLAEFKTFVIERGIILPKIKPVIAI